jgi:hypothetical protein
MRTITKSLKKKNHKINFKNQIIQPGAKPGKSLVGARACKPCLRRCINIKIQLSDAKLTMPDVIRSI